MSLVRSESDFLRRFQEVFTPRAQSAGFELTDRVAWSYRPWLEYRATDTAEIFLLDIFHGVWERTITAELWRPTRLKTALRAGVPEQAIEWRRAWHYEDRTDTADLAREVAETVAEWLAGPSDYNVA
jgi:hypothetical protein